MAHKPLLGYPNTGLGNKYVEIIDRQGPASYSAETFAASSLGWGGFDAVIPLNGGQIAPGADKSIVALSISGTYYVTARLGTGAAGLAVASVTLRWYVASTGVECGAIDLSSEYVRLLCIGV